MKNPEMLDIYSDYLLASFHSVTATGLSKMLDEGYSHDQISRFLAQSKFTQKDYWQTVKKLVRKVESPSGILVIDDTIEEKPYSTENEIICWHWDHSKDCMLKGINIVNFLYYNELENGEAISLPVSFEIVEKTEQYLDKKTNTIKRRSNVSKNEIVIRRLRVLHQLNKLQFKYLAWDIWFSSKENFDFVNYELKKYFVAGLKSNRTVALTKEDKLKGKFTQIEALNLQQNQIARVWLKGLDFEVLIVKKVFTNKDGSTGIAYIVTNDLSLDQEQIGEIYQKRWKIEEFHKSIKQNAGLEKSPTKYEITQSNHIFASMIAFCKLELLKCKEKLNHFALKSKLYIKAVKAAFNELQVLKAFQHKIEPSKSTFLMLE
jgi:hypothetical protein